MASSSIAPSSQDGSTKRTFTSCRRCKVRKIKCDAGLTACTPCVKAGADCLDVTRTGQEVPRSVNVELGERIIYLERIIRSRCPDVDLSVGPGAQAMKELSSDFEELVQAAVQAGQRDVPVMDVPQLEGWGLPPAAAAPVQPILRPLVSGSIASPNWSSAREEVTPHKRQRDGQLAASSSSESPSHVTFNMDASPHSSAPPDDLSHEVGLVSLAGSSDRKYVGPSSGFSFAKLIRATIQASFSTTTGAGSGAGGTSETASQTGMMTPFGQRAQGPFRASLLRRRLQDSAVSTSFAMPDLSVAATLVDIFFADVHYQFPCLYARDFYREVERLYDADLATKPIASLRQQDHVAVYQVTMVLAIAAAFSPDRSGVDVGPLSFFRKAMSHLEYVVGDVTTLERTQCIVLLAIFALYSPSAPNAWTLSYHLMANCVDLGLQRYVGPEKQISQVEIDLRKRVFWTAYTLDRTLCVSLGRPLSLRDEGFDVPMPANVEDEELASPGFSPFTVNPLIITNMSPSIRIFEIMQICTDIKLHLHRVKREANRFPWPTNLAEFRQRTADRLAVWRSTALLSTTRASVRATLEMRYHQAMLLLYRPSPAFPICDADALARCAASSRDLILLSDSQQRAGLLSRTFLHLHEIFLSGLTLLFCLSKGTPASIPPNRYAPELRASSSILAALSETWPEARNARNILDRLVDTVLSTPSAATASGSSLVGDITLESFNETMQSILGDAMPSMDDSSALFSFDSSQTLTTDLYNSVPSRGLLYGMGDLGTNASLQALLDSMTGEGFDDTWDSAGPHLPGP